MILSDRQKQAFKFFGSDYDMLFADGAVRSGKTYSLTHAFLLWTLNFAGGYDFGLAGRTIGTLKRNIIYPFLVPLQGDPLIKQLGGIKFNWAENFFMFHGNTFNWFGGDKETSQFLIQGKTLAGLFCDEVVAMLRSFVDQAMARCSVDGSKIVFTDNPGNPTHYFKTDFIDKAHELNAQYMHWTMDDNPSLSPKIRARYERMYSGVFYERYILGRWVAAEGVIFLQFANNPDHWLFDKPANDYLRLYIGVDFGGSKAKTVFVLSGIRNGANGPEIHILDAYAIKDNGLGVDADQIAGEWPF